MHDIENRRGKVPGNAFLNRREWRSYMAALQSAASPRVMGVVKSGRDWISTGASHASHWLSGSDSLKDELRLG